jgi:hypothetical protein
MTFITTPAHLQLLENECYSPRMWGPACVTCSVRHEDPCSHRRHKDQSQRTEGTCSENLPLHSHNHHTAHQHVAADL